MREPRSFFGQKPRVFEISSPVFNIDFLVRDVDVTAKGNLASSLSEFSHMRFKGAQKAVLCLLTVISARSGRKVHGDYGKPLKVQAYITPFGIKFGGTETDHDIFRFNS